MRSRARVRWLLGLVLLLPGSGALWAQSHPRMVLTPEVLARLRARAAAKDSAWTALVGGPGGALLPCAHITQATFGTPDGLPPVYAPRDAITARTAGMAVMGYHGSGYYDALHNLGLCYQVVHDSNPKLANRYATQAVKVLQAMSAPFATATVDRTGFTRVLYYVNNTGPGGQAQAFVTGPEPELAPGTNITVQGVLGCTEANGARRVASVAGNSFLLTEPSGAPVLCSAPGANRNHNFLADSGYPIRFFLPGLAIGYDWFYDRLDDATKRQIWATMNAWVREFHMLHGKPGDGNSYRTRTQSNYHAGYYAAVGLAAIATRGENPEAEALYQMWRNEIHLGRDQPFCQQWLGPYGGFPEAWTYLPQSETGIGMALLSNLTAFGDDLIGNEAQPFPWMTGLMRYFMHSASPGLTHLMERGYVVPPASTPDVLRVTPSMYLLPYYLSKVRKEPAAPAYRQFMDDVLAEFFRIPGTANWSPLWQRFLFDDPDDARAEWLQERPSLASLANPAGGYGHVLMRSDWTSNAVLASFLAHPQTSDGYNGKERMDKGSLIVQSGDRHLLVSPLAEATRSGNAKAYAFVADASTVPALQTLYYSLYYVTRPGWTSQQWPAISRVSVRSPGSNDAPPDLAVALPFTVQSIQGSTFIAPSHGLKNGYLVYFYTSSTFPKGLTAGGVYYVRDAGADSFRVSRNPGVAACSAARDCIDVDAHWSGTLSGWAGADAVIVTAHPTRIDRYEDQDSYVYSRGVGLEALTSYDEEKPGFFPMAKWSREVLYVRPRVFLVYDRTQKRAVEGSSKFQYSQYLAWTVGKTPVVRSDCGAGMLCVEVADGDKFKGAITTVVPPRSSASIVDLGGYGVVHQIRVAPAENTASTHWLTVIDASTTRDQLTSVRRLAGNNVDAVQLDSSTVAGFVVNSENGAGFSYSVEGEQATVHVIAGLTPSGVYRAQWDGRMLTVAPGGDGAQVTATEAGVLYLSTRGGRQVRSLAKPGRDRIAAFPAGAPMKARAGHWKQAAGQRDRRAEAASRSAASR